jgi:hypothetical protein
MGSGEVEFEFGELTDNGIRIRRTGRLAWASVRAGDEELELAVWFLSAGNVESLKGRTFTVGTSAGHSARAALADLVKTARNQRGFRF